MKKPVVNPSERDCPECMGAGFAVVKHPTRPGVRKNSFVTLRTIVPEAIPIAMTMGNHEYYHRFMGEELEPRSRTP